MNTKHSIAKRMISALVLFAVLSLTVYAWFYFPLTQYTTVYTDGVKDSRVKAWVFDRQNNIFSPILPNDSTSSIDLSFRSDYDYREIIQPFFFLWGGEYTTNDFHETIYKVDVTYSNANSAFPTKLRLYGDFDFTSYCIGHEEQIDIRFMKIMYYIPEGSEDIGYTNPDNYTLFTDSEYEDGITKDFGLIDLSLLGPVNPVDFDYTTTVYFIVTTDLDVLQTYAEDLYEETGILDAVFTSTANLYYRTEPANVISEP